MKDKKISVLFVCLGNICRSPMAEGIFSSLVQESNLTQYFEIDSAGTSGWHNGELADPNMRETANKHGITLTHRSRKFIVNDFSAFDYIIPMDQSNLRNIRTLLPQGEIRSEIELMRAFDNANSGLDVEDPYGMSMNGFENCYQVLLESCQNLLDHLVTVHDIK
ncbi:low molecular weight protein-tyrosine-phosphatase [Limibacter armeniacum]|uniref:low molecular weight protein-tyrosine-phosphatase n=1 Tax=Limibacter armeniacum TaxID=466084 RepID=UPI002FE57BAA